MVRRPTPEEIRAARAAAGLTQLQAAALVHRTGPKSRNRWSEWENGHVAMPLAEWELFMLKTAQRKRSGHGLAAQEVVDAADNKK